MNITTENKKQKAIELMGKLDIYKPYIKEFCLSKGFTIDDKTIRQSIENAWDEMTNAKKDKVA